MKKKVDPAKHLRDCATDLEATLNDPKWVDEFERNPELAAGLQKVITRVHKAVGVKEEPGE